MTSARGEETDGRGGLLAISGFSRSTLISAKTPDETLAFWRALGFAVTWEQHKPYLYLAFRWSGFELHYGRTSEGVDPAQERTGGCLVPE